MAELRWLISDIGTLDEVAFRARLPALSGSFTLALWFYPERLDRRQVLVKLGPVYQDGWLIVLEDHRIQVERAQGGGSRVMAAAAGPVAGRWQHVAVVVDGAAGQARVYLDGAAADSRPITAGDLPAGLDEILIGGYTDPAGGHYDYTFGRLQSGWIDDVRCWPGVLPPAEIEGLAARPAGEPIPQMQVTPDALTAPAGVLFDASASVVPGGTVRACLWDFGDGATALGSAARHTYRYAGRYAARLTVLGDNHRQAVLEQPITLSGEDNPLRQTPVFVNGSDGYACYRIPAIVRAANGDLVAFAEGRVESCSDSTETIHIVCRRSADHGRTWGGLQVLARNSLDGRESVVNNPSPVVDLVRGSGRIILLYNKARHTEWELSSGAGSSRIYSLVSDDHGATWHSETDISAQVQQMPGWHVQRPALGHALQMPDGRIVYAGMFTASAQTVFQSQNYLFWSDDLGATWHRGSAAPHVGLNEAAAVDLEDGRVLINSRAYIDQRPAGCRALTVAAFTPEGDVRYEPTRFDHTLPDSAVQASILRLSYRHQARAGSRSRLLFSNPAHPGARSHMTVRLSYDEGQTWSAGRLVDAGPSSYSDLVIQADGRIGLLYERGNQGGIVYVNFTLAWLTDGADQMEASS